ncbi:hypothetical protein [Hirschia baltica]|uniref:DUF4352 domain-containing protein n=1 Tax=Hirschia baltica (strain ATCC 49814 / DSM 5838 / IFAM 1418) TaxID=582402 RepID=C6XI21_HIRBI|nr:hypothetical protein [Hirschia baltica]ACT58847.1 hypothetical protein Hbal_1155 [Hirschia baltica ATCC 49814]
MRNISSTVLALAAMVLSSMTTYLTFFDARYTLTAAIADVKGQVNRGFSSNSETKSASYRFYIDASLVLSNRGTRSLVVSDVSVVKSSNADKCIIAEDEKRVRVQEYSADGRQTAYIKPFIVEPGTVGAKTFWMNPSSIDQEVAASEEFDLKPTQDLWCFEWKVFDPNGKKHENSMPAFLLDVSFDLEEGETTPEGIMKIEGKSGPTELLKRGLF